MEGRGQRLGNLFARAVLRTPVLHRAVSNRMLIITTVGRRTGNQYRMPVGYAEAAGALLIGTAGTWHRNLRPGVPVEVLLRRRRLRALPEVIGDEETAAPLYGEILRHNPVHGRYAGIRLAGDGRPDPDDLRAALARGARVVRLRLADAGPATPVGSAGPVSQPEG
jgi:deazaflavin-dependent oxidoreductase (nitroreductase family)